MLRNSGSVALATVTYSDTKPDRFTVIFGLGWVGLVWGFGGSTVSSFKHAPFRLLLISIGRVSICIL